MSARSIEYIELIIYTKNINWVTMQGVFDAPDTAANYVKNLIPQWALCVPSIVNNQRYYHAINVRNATSVPYKVRTPVVQSLVEGISISGICTDFITIDELLNACDKDSLITLLKEFKNGRIN